ncbi:TIGR03960 family B12-binding radical SAM protein [Candidatus Riflebacteria bacterium]
MKSSFAGSHDFLEHILAGVEKPGRYIGGESNSQVKSGEKRTSLALFFPDIYEIGMSNLGFRILYEVINEREEFLAERVFSPWPDFEAELLAHRVPLFSLENKKALNTFDVVAFTLQYELTFTNVINGLKLGRIPVFSSERGEEEPLVIAGGPVCGNPEPLADFIDAFCIGEGEELIIEIMELVAWRKKNGKSRKELLEKLSRLQGIYIPVFYEVSNKDFTLKPRNPSVPEQIDKRVFLDFATSSWPMKPIIPNIPITQDRVVVELFRGCPHQCRYCQAVKFYNKVRIRQPAEVLKIIGNQLKNSGYLEVGLSSLSTTDYPCLEEVIKLIREKYPEVSVSFPSLRIDKSLQIFSDEVFFRGYLKRQNLTLAPECGTDRLRKALRKSLTNVQLFDLVEMAFKNRVEVVKLYFMIGLPTEREEDIQALIDMGRQLHGIARKYGKKKKIKMSINPFVPKSHTAFQWDSMNSIDQLLQKQKKIVNALKHLRSLQLNYRDPAISYLECILSRGDRKLGKLLLKQVEKGFRFDGWYAMSREMLDDWRSTAFELGFALDKFAYQAIEEGKALPWEHIKLFSSVEILRKERNEAENTLP